MITHCELCTPVVQGKGGADAVIHMRFPMQAMQLCDSKKETPSVRNPRWVP